MENEIRLSFLSKKCNIAIVRNMIGVILIEYNPTISFINEMKTVVSEAITNAIIHGYDSREDEFIDVNIFINDERIIVDVIDKGVGIEDIELAREALYSTKMDEERSGLGFTIMELFSYELIVESKVGEGTYLHIEKKW